MFRDPSYFRTLREEVVPHLKTYPSLKIWIAGCSTGEELYSLAILFREEGLESRTIFYATDFSPMALRKAEAGIYEADRIPLFTQNQDRKSTTSELQSLMRISYAVFCLKKKNIQCIDHINNYVCYTRQTS